jgi:uncharacterized protein YukE
LVDVRATADPGKLRQQARELCAVADDLETDAGDFDGATTGLAWRGESADAFGNDVRAYRAKAKTQAGQLRAIATELREGAAEIERYRASVEEARRKERKQATQRP